jgi:copper chaperone CopZ
MLGIHRRNIAHSRSDRPEISLGLPKVRDPHSTQPRGFAVRSFEAKARTGKTKPRTDQDPSQQPARIDPSMKELPLSVIRSSLLASILSVATSPLLSSSALASQVESRIDMAINGMVCSFCSQGIERKLRTLGAVQTIKVNIEKHHVSVLLRPGKQVSDDQLRKLVRDAGFEVREIKRSESH